MHGVKSLQVLYDWPHRFLSINPPRNRMKKRLYNILAVTLLVARDCVIAQQN